jgi:hypothetical protein
MPGLGAHSSIAGALDFWSSEMFADSKITAVTTEAAKDVLLTGSAELLTRREVRLLRRVAAGIPEVAILSRQSLGLEA